MICTPAVLFKPYLAERILDGTKTETRRLWRRCVVKVAYMYKAMTGYRSEAVFGTIMVTYVRKETLGSINGEGVKREGCGSLDEFKQIWVDSYS